MDKEPVPKVRSELCETKAEELASTITHGIGVLLSIAALVLLCVSSGGDPWKATAGAIFGTSLILLYLSSTLYHTMSSPRAKSFFQILDHSAIYLLIAGSYTPIALVTLRGPLGWTLFGITWGMAIMGILMKSLMKNNREHWISTALYLIMGWLALIAIGPIFRELPKPGLIMLVAGGLSYSFGVIFFVWTSLKYNHSLWHLFVLAGSILHALMVILYIF